MANITAIMTAIRGRVKTLITDAIPIVTQFDNQAPIVKPATASWASCAIYPTLSKRRTISNNPLRIRHYGELRIQLFTPLLMGDNAAWAIADTVKDSFTAVTVSDVKFTTPIVTRLGHSQDGKWWQVLVVCPYQADELT